MAVQGEDGTTRAFNSFALRTVPLDAGRCRLEVVDYFDMRGWFPTCAPALCMRCCLLLMHRQALRMLRRLAAAVSMEHRVMVGLL